jgi:hypothetical protein
VVILLVWATGPRDWDLNFPGFERAVFKHIDEIIRSKRESFFGTRRKRLICC